MYCLCDLGWAGGFVFRFDCRENGGRKWIGTGGRVTDRALQALLSCGGRAWVK